MLKCTRSVYKNDRVLFEIKGGLMNFILNILEQDYISNVYIGVTGILVAIVIFIAEVIKDQDNELNKKVILYRTNIRENIINVLLIFFYMIIINMFKYNQDINICERYNIIYLITHGILLVLVIMSIYKTGKMFGIALKLNTEKDYFNEELEKYIYIKSMELEKRANSKNNKRYKKEKNEFSKFLKEQEIYFNDERKVKNNSDYEAIYPIKNGIIEKYDYKKLIELSNYFNNQKINEENYVADNKDIVFIPNNIGKRVNKKEPIFYCLKQYKNIFKNLSNLVIYADNSLFIDDEIKLINSCLFKMASEYEEPDAYDENHRLLNYFIYLYNNELYGIKALALANIEEYYRKIYNNFSKNRQFARFLGSLSLLAYSNDDYDDYEYINNVDFYLYIHQMNEKEIDIKKITYDCANNIFDFNLYSVKQNSDIRYYDNLMSLLLKFIIYLMKSSNYSAINVLFDNILMERINYKDNEFDEYDIVNFQFSCGIIYCLIMLSTHNKIIETSLDTIKRMINYIENSLINLYDAWDTIEYFKKYFNKKTCVQNVYAKYDFEFIDHEYKNSWRGYPIDATIVLKEFLFVFEIDFVNINSINKEQISRKDKYFYKRLLELINSKEPNELDKLLNVKYNNNCVVEVLNIAIQEAEAKEKEYNRIHELDNNKVEQFKKLIKQNIQKDSSFINSLRKYNKIKDSKSKLKRVFGINQLIPRELFFDNAAGYKIIAENYCSTLDIGIEKEYIKKINKISKKSAKPLEVILDQIDNIEDYIIISNYLNKSYLNKFDYDYSENVIIYKNKKIPIINIPQINGIFLLPKEDLPTINFCDFKEEWNSKFIDNSLYCELIDCSKDENLRKKILEESIWLKEKGTVEEQDNYLKEYCRIRLYLAYKIVENKNATIIKFENEYN